VLSGARLGGVFYRHAGIWTLATRKALFGLRSVAWKANKSSPDLGMIWPPPPGPCPRSGIVSSTSCEGGIGIKWIDHFRTQGADHQVFTAIVRRTLHVLSMNESTCETFLSPAALLRLAWSEFGVAVLPYCLKTCDEVGLLLSEQFLPQYPGGHRALILDNRGLQRVGQFAA
jgi:hypothetical protein